MGGETRPWGVAYGPRGQPPKILSVANGRNRVDIESMMEIFAVDLLTHFRTEGYSFDPINKDNLPEEDSPQIWVPNSSHLDMLHCLSYAYWKLRSLDDRAEANHALSRLCGWLYLESSIKGQQVVIDASAAIREAFVFPIDDVSQAHLDSYSAWLASNNATFEERMIQGRLAAEQSLGITLEPNIEDKPVKSVENVQEAAKLQSIDPSAETGISDILESELLRRWSATENAFKLLDSDPRSTNKGLGVLVRDSMSRYVFDFQRLELQRADPERGPAFTPHPETDNHGSAAASRYYLRQAADSKYLPTLVHDDAELLAEAVSEGRTIKGVVTEVDAISSGQRSTDFFWTIQLEAADDFRMRAGEKLSPLGNQKHSVTTVFVEFTSETEVAIRLFWTARKTMKLEAPMALKPGDAGWLGQEVIFVPFDSSEFNRKASQAVWNASSGAGAWLTHSKGKTYADRKVVDDVVQLQGVE